MSVFEVIFFLIICPATTLWSGGAWLYWFFLPARKAKIAARSKPDYWTQQEIDQTPAWWDREFRRLNGEPDVVPSVGFGGESTELLQMAHKHAVMVGDKERATEFEKKLWDNALYLNSEATRLRKIADDAKRDLDREEAKYWATYGGAMRDRPLSKSKEVDVWRQGADPYLNGAKPIPYSGRVVLTQGGYMPDSLSPYDLVVEY